MLTLVQAKTSRWIIAAVATLATTAAVLLAGYLLHDSPSHGGAFEGPCTYRADAPNGPSARLSLTDYGPPVQVRYLVVEERDVHGSIINANRVEVDTTVSTQETRIFTAPAISGTSTCRLLNWG